MKKVLKTKNGRSVKKDDIQSAFSVVKTILLDKGHHVNIALTNINKKEEAEKKVMDLLDEYADNKYRKLQPEEHACSCKEKDKYIEKLEKMSEDLLEENVELYIRAGKRYWKEACLWLAAISGWSAFVIALIVG